MILDNANILTMNETMPTASAIAIAGGRVLGGVDSREDPIASQAHERINLQGATVVPGFVDAHTHFRAWALARVRLDLRACGSFDELLEAVRRRAATGDDAGGWLLGSGWEDGVVPRDTNVAVALDSAAGGRPAALVSHDGHALLVTPATLAATGIAEADLDQPGGVVGRDAAGTFTGVLRETSAWHVRRALPEPDMSTKTMAAAMREAARRGVTCVHDMDGARGLRSWRALERERGLSLRVVQHLLADELEFAEQLGVDGGFGGERLRLGGIKAFADGTLGSGTAWLAEPEIPAPGQVPREAVVITDRAELTSLARRAAEAGFPVLVHAIGDAAVHAVVDALERTQEWWGHLPAAPRIEHAQLMSVADMERCARLGIALSVQPSHLVADRDAADLHWGAARTPDAYAFRSMENAGCGLLLGSDAPIEDLNPLAALHAAIERDGGAHGLPTARGAWHPEQTISADTALRACTSWPADAAGLGGELGRLTPGMAADLVVLSGNPQEMSVADIEVVATMLGGRWTHGAANLR